MSDIAIKCNGLSKQYRLGQQERYKALREVITDGLYAPIKWARTTFDGRRRTVDGNGAGHRSSVNGRGQTIWALDDVSFDVKRGEVVGIIGRNGAGKTTLLKILSRITKPTRGHAEIHGRIGSLLEVGTGFHPELTGRENIYLNGAILGMRKAEIDRKFDEIVAFAEVEKFIDTPVKRYSSGMYVRLAFAVAAHMEPEILIVDEVLAVGDAAFQKKCLGKMGDVARRGRTVLLVSHNMGALRGLCTEVIWIESGRMVRTGPPAEVIDQYMATVNKIGFSSIALGDRDRGEGLGERLRIQQIEFNEGGPILHGEPLRARIHFVTASQIQGVAFGFGFSSLEGTRLMTIDSDLGEARRDLARNSRGSVEAFVPQLHLQPGQYSLDIGVRSGANNFLDYLGGCAAIEVVASSQTPPEVIRSVGGVRPPANWHWSTDGESEREVISI